MLSDFSRTSEKRFNTSVRRRCVRGGSLSPLAIALTGMILLASGPGIASTFSVNSTGDDGDSLPGDGLCFTGLFTQTGPGVFTAACTLRAAMEEANALAGADLVEFAATLPKVAGVVEIRPETRLPIIVDAVTVNGYSADGYDVNDPTESPIINLSGSLLPEFPSVSGLHISQGGSNTRIQGLAIFDFTGSGILMTSALPRTQNVTIEGCELGIWRGVFYRGNDSHGIHARSARNLTIGRTCGTQACSGQRNVIARNGGSGIRLEGSTFVDIAGNLIGTDKSGTTTSVAFGGSTPNAEWGIEATAGSRNRIGLPVIGGENLISGNTLGGIYINEGGDIVLNNKIGTNLAGTAALPNAGTGIDLRAGSNTVGSTVIWGGNLISGNGVGGISSTGPNSIVGNVIGLSVNESVPVGNTSSGLFLYGAGAQVRNNVIGGNGVHGILAFGDDHEILSNRIGTNTANEDMENLFHGIVLSRTENVVVGRAGEGNIVGFNNLGIAVGGDSVNTVRNFIQGNFVGTNAQGDDLGNASSGIHVTDATDTLVGGVGALESGRGNVIGFNGGYGVRLTRFLSSGSGNQVAGNYIGTNASGDALGNQSGGVGISAEGYTVGANLDDPSEDVAAHGNRIANNTGPAIEVFNDGLNAVARGNEIYANGGGATPIDLEQDGPTVNDVGDIDTGANNQQNSPEFITTQTQVDEISGDLEVRYRVYSNEADAAYPLTIDFYLITEPGGFMDVYVGSDIYPVESATVFRSVAIETPSGVAVEGMLLAIATDAQGNSSEVSRQSVPVPEPRFGAGLALGVLGIFARSRKQTTPVCEFLCDAGR